RGCRRRFHGRARRPPRPTRVPSTPLFRSSIGLEIYKNLTLGDLERRKFRAGEVIFKEGADAKGEAFLVHAGTVQIKRTFDGAETTVSTLGAGGPFGDLALLRAAPRSAAAV